jgi:FKBP-type peptidyl-prolyl cis-trans isomerase
LKKYSLYPFVFLFFLFASCWQQEKHKGYTELDSGLFYKLQFIGDGTKKATFGDYLQLITTYKTKNDSVFLDSYSTNISGKVILPYNSISFKGSFEEYLKQMNEGDSVSFIVDADSLFSEFFKAKLPLFLHSGDIVKMDVKLFRILNEAEYQQEINNYNQLVEDADIEEQRKLKVFLDTVQTKYNLLPSGISYLPIKQGAGDFPQSGDLVKVHFKGSFLTGKFLESTYDRKQTFDFTIGQQGQVIKGLEYSIKMLNEGAQAKFIIPSQLAYGESGSSTGIIPPYTTLIYEIELVKIIKQNTK